MKKAVFSLTLFFSLLLLLSTSCTLQKRHYRPGFYHEQNNSSEVKQETQQDFQSTISEVKKSKQQILSPGEGISSTSDSIRGQKQITQSEKVSEHTFPTTPEQQFKLSGYPVAKSSTPAFNRPPDPGSMNWATVAFLLSIVGIILSIALTLILLDLAGLLAVAIFILLAVIFGSLSVVINGDAKEKAASENPKSVDPDKPEKPAHKRNVPLAVLIWGLVFFACAFLQLAVAGIYLAVIAGILPLLIIGIIQLVKNKKAGDKKRELRQVIFGMLFGLIALGVGYLLVMQEGSLW